MAVQFLRRDSCPLCQSPRQRPLCDLGYDKPALSGFIERFYAGRVQPDWLAAGRYRVVACADCDFIYQDPLLDEAGMRALYSDWVDQAASLKKKRDAGAGLYLQYAGQVQTLLRLFARPPRQVRVLDFGMGWGYWCRMAQAHGLTVSGYDFSTARREHARRMGIEALEDLPARAGEFDFIYANQVFEHLAEPLPILRQLCGQLADDGILHIRVPDGRGVARRLRRHGWSAEMSAIHPLEHVNCFTRASLIRFAAQAGLRPFQPPLRLHWGRLAGGLRREIMDRWLSPHVMFRR